MNYKIHEKTYQKPTIYQIEYIFLLSFKPKLFLKQKKNP